MNTFLFEMQLGTNDVTRNRDDSDQINITATQAISKINQTFPESQIAVCGILPRKGRGQHLIKMNDTSNHVNCFLKTKCVLEMVHWTSLISTKNLVNKVVQ